MKWRTARTTSYGSWILIPTIVLEDASIHPRRRGFCIQAHWLQWGFEISFYEER